MIMPFYFYLSPDKLARKIYLSDRFYVRIGTSQHGNSTALKKQMALTEWYISFIVKYIKIVNTVIIQILLLEWVSNWLLFTTKWTSCRLYHGENKLCFYEMMMMSAVY
jgi:hypothetical protein